MNELLPPLTLTLLGSSLCLSALSVLHTNRSRVLQTCFTYLGIRVRRFFKWCIIYFRVDFSFLLFSTAPDLPSAPQNVSHMFIIGTEISVNISWEVPLNYIQPLTGYRIVWTEYRPHPTNFYRRGFPVLHSSSTVVVQAVSCAKYEKKLRKKGQDTLVSVWTGQ